MSLKNMSKEELELLSYTDLTYMLLKEGNTSMNTPTIFKLICDLLDYSDEEYASKIGDYYTSLNIDKRFVLLENNEWDLREKHPVQIVIDDEEDLDETSIIDDEFEEEEDNYDDGDEDIDAIVDDEDIDDLEDEIEDLAIVSEEDVEEEI